MNMKNNVKRCSFTIHNRYSSLPPHRFINIAQCSGGKVARPNRYSGPKPVADPEFPNGGGANPKGGANLLFCQFYPKTA